MVDMEEITRRLKSNAEGICILLETLSEEQAEWKPAPDIWSMKDVIEHVYNEERLDFRRHLKEMLSEPPQPWGEFSHEDYIKVDNYLQALEGFLREREDSALLVERARGSRLESRHPACLLVLQEIRWFSA